MGKCLIDAKGQSGIFVVGLGGILTLKDLDLTGGFCTKGSAVLVSGLGANSNAAVGKLRAINVKFFNNIATVSILYISHINRHACILLHMGVTTRAM